MSCPKTPSWAAEGPVLYLLPRAVTLPVGWRPVGHTPGVRKRLGECVHTPFLQERGEWQLLRTAPEVQ